MIRFAKFSTLLVPENAAPPAPPADCRPVCSLLEFHAAACPRIPSLAKHRCECARAWRRASLSPLEAFLSASIFVLSCEPNSRPPNILSTSGASGRPWRYVCLAECPNSLCFLEGPAGGRLELLCVVYRGCGTRRRIVTTPPYELGAFAVFTRSNGLLPVSATQVHPIFQHPQRHFQHFETRWSVRLEKYVVRPTRLAWVGYRQ